MRRTNLALRTMASIYLLGGCASVEPASADVEPASSPVAHEAATTSYDGMTIGGEATELKIISQPCDPLPPKALPHPAAPQIEFGLWAPSDGKDALFGDPHWYGGYRCD